jgi:hypothetical protein
MRQIELQASIKSNRYEVIEMYTAYVPFLVVFASLVLFEIRSTFSR